MSSARGDPSPKCLSDVVGIGHEWPIVIEGSDIDVDVDADLVTEVQCASLVSSLRQTLLALCEAAGVDSPTFTWE